jgi:hypothetical protein
VDHVHVGVEGGVDVLSYDSRKAADGGFKPFGCDHPDGLKIAPRGYWKTGLDDVHTELVELPSDGDLLLRGQGNAGGLFTISEGGVEKPNFFSTQCFDVIENDPTQMILAS